MVLIISKLPCFYLLGLISFEWLFLNSAQFPELRYSFPAFLFQ